MDTRSIQRAIDKAYENGGGIVNIPPGIYMIGTLILKDNVNLHLQTVAVLLGSPDYRDYTEIIHKFESRTNGLSAHNLKISPLKFNVDITKRGSLQLCLLILNESSVPEKVLVMYEGITQEFIINWNEWGWAPITLLKEFPTDQQVDFEIIAAGENTNLKITKAYVRYQNLPKTD